MSNTPLNQSGWTRLDTGPLAVTAIGGPIMLIDAGIAPPAAGSVGWTVAAGTSYKYMGNAFLYAKAASAAATSASHTELKNSEGIGATLRRLRAAAKFNNPAESPMLVGAQAWAVGLVIPAGGIVSVANGIALISDAGGTTAGTMPTLAALGNDTGVVWRYFGPQTAPVISVSYQTHNATYSNRYLAPASSAPLVPWPSDGSVVFRMGGGLPMSDNNHNDGLSFCANYAPLSGNIDAPDGHNSTFTSVTFVSEANILEVATYANAQPRAVIVDGQYCDYRVPGGTIWFPGFFTIDFTNVRFPDGSTPAKGRQRHEITIEMGTGEALVAVSVLPTEKLHYPPTPDNFSIAFVGDSQSVAHLLTMPGDGFFNQMKHMMGVIDSAPCGIGGTGFVSSGTATNYAGHAVADLQLINAYRPIKVIFVMTSQNDTPVVAQVGAKVTSFITSLRAAFPSAIIAVMGGITGGGIDAVNQPLNEAAVLAAVAALQTNDSMLVSWPCATDPFGPWITGTVGHVGGTNGSGTTDVNTNTDSQHMTVDGHLLWARKSVAAFFAAIQNIP